MRGQGISLKNASRNSCRRARLNSINHSRGSEGEDPDDRCGRAEWVIQPSQGEGQAFGRIRQCLMHVLENG
jgi:hypothetical protein